MFSSRRGVFFTCSISFLEASRITSYFRDDSLPKKEELLLNSYPETQPEANWGCTGLRVSCGPALLEQCLRCPTRGA